MLFAILSRRLEIGARPTVGLTILMLAVFLGLGLGSALAQEHFAGKQIRVIVPTSSSGGGYGLYGQLAASHLGRFIAGNPTVVVSYMPGAAGLVAMNYLYEIAPRDGTVIAVMSQDLATYQARGTKGVRYDAARFSYIGRATSNVPVHMVWHTAKARSIADIRIHEVITGAVGSRGTHFDMPTAQNALLGTKWKVIGGYPGGNEVRIAMERGEVQAAVAPATLFNSQLKPLLDQGLVSIVVQYADFRHPELPNVPTIVELAETAEAKGVFKFLVSLATLGRSYAAPPGVPENVVGILRQGFEAMVEDAAFKAEAQKLGADLMPMPGGQLAAHVKEVIATPTAIVKRTNEVVGTN